MTISTQITKAIESGIPPKIWDDFKNKDVIPHINKLKCAWPAIAESLRHNVYFVSIPYGKALRKSKQPFIKMFQESEDVGELIKGLTDGVSRCYIESTSSLDGKVDYKYIYTILANNGSVKCFAQFFDFMPAAFILLENEEKVAAFNMGLSDVMIDGFKTDEIIDRIDIVNHGDTIGKCVTDMYIHLCFEKYAKVETREVAPSCSCRPSLQHLEVLKNDTRLKIHIRDSTWFTTICRNEGFNVRGHFRLQPKKKDGEWTRELIYISPYQKTGYHRLASIINGND